MTLVLRLGSLDDCGVANEEMLPRGRWEDRNGLVWIQGVGLVKGCYGSKHVEVKETTRATCQRCKQVNVVWPVALWVRFEGALERDMYWFGPIPGQTPSYCATCLPFGQ